MSVLTTTAARGMRLSLRVLLLRLSMGAGGRTTAKTSMTGAGSIAKAAVGVIARCSCVAVASLRLSSVGMKALLCTSAWMLRTLLGHGVLRTLRTAEATTLHRIVIFTRRSGGRHLRMSAIGRGKASMI